MIARSYWIRQIEEAWRERSVIWLAGVRRVGKTVLCQSLDEIEYFDCELPSVRQALGDPEDFLQRTAGKRIALDEIHRLGNPTELLKIAADHFPQTRVVATGSSTLQASAHFRDTLTGRKRELRLLPVLLAECESFGIGELSRRLLHGGLPGYLLSESVSESEYVDWLEAFWSRDIQELFRVERRRPFLRLIELLALESGGIFEASRYAAACEISRPTVLNYLSVLEESLIVTPLRPFATRSSEIVRAPKYYVFDSGMVAAFGQLSDRRSDDLGRMFEHVIFNELLALHGPRHLRYWRDKRGHEVDFVFTDRSEQPTAIECKWRAEGFSPVGIQAFRRRYQGGTNYVIAGDVRMPYRREYGDIKVEFVSPLALDEQLLTSL